MICIILCRPTLDPDFHRNAKLTAVCTPPPLTTENWTLGPFVALAMSHFTTYAMSIIIIWKYTPDFPCDIKLIRIAFPINSLNHNLVVSNCDYVMNPVVPSRGNNFKFFNHFMWFSCLCVSFSVCVCNPTSRGSERICMLKMWGDFTAFIFAVRFLGWDGWRSTCGRSVLLCHSTNGKIKQFLLCFTTKCDIIASANNAR